MSAAFHPPVANNFVHMLVPRGRDLAAYVQQIGDTTAALNHADLGLLEHCTELLAGADEHVATEALASWRACLQRRVNLQAGRFVPTVLSACERRTGRTMHEHLAAAAPEVLARFRSVPRGLLELVRVNAYLPARAMALAHARIAARLEAGGFAAPIERLELARLAETTGTQAPDFPTVIVYLAIDDTAATEIAATFAELSRIFASLAPAPTLRRELAWPLGTHATLTQGFTLFKRYLGWLGLLDEHYDATFDHALCHGSRLAAIVRSPNASVVCSPRRANSCAGSSG